MEKVDIEREEEALDQAILESEGRIIRNSTIFRSAEGPTPATRAFDEWARGIDEWLGVKEPAPVEEPAPLKFESLDIVDQIDFLTLGSTAVTDTVIL